MGELEKRIKELENEFEDLYGDLDLMFRRNPKINLMKIVEEMRKEFLDMHPCECEWFKKWLK